MEATGTAYCTCRIQQLRPKSGRTITRRRPSGRNVAVAESDRARWWSWWSSSSWSMPFEPWWHTVSDDDDDRSKRPRRSRRCNRRESDTISIGCCDSSSGGDTLLVSSDTNNRCCKINSNDNNSNNNSKSGSVNCRCCNSCFSSNIDDNSNKNSYYSKNSKISGRSCYGSGDDVSWTIAFLLLLCLSVATSAAAQLRPDSDISVKREEGVCQSRDIRNSVRDFSQLRGCRVVEGFVQIVLIDKANESEYANISFPELTEITGYLLIYRVNGLRSLSNMFPNLAVIRGNTLFFNYALIIFEMLHLQELGLKSLTDVLRGAVYINKNPMLCFVDSIDWDKIAKSSPGGHFIAGNKRRNECPICPTTCPTSATGEPLCWNSQHCQKLCSQCKLGQACMDDGTCCDESCSGGCNGTTNANCVACRGVLFQGECLSTCPATTYKYLDRRCVLENECYDMLIPREKANEDLRQRPYKPFQNECRLECPPNYMETKTPDNKFYTCEPCKGPCKKECAGLSVDSISSAQKLRGCTYIKSSLEIQIRGGSNVVKELEESLSMIEEIHGYLKIVRSFPIMSLNFLKKLRVIHGNVLESNKFALVILDNQNLIELWDFDTRGVPLEIRKGKLFFHFNPKLCLYKIENLRKRVHLPPFTELEVASNSNGDKVACNITKLDARITVRRSNAVLVEWNQFEHYDSRGLLSYLVYYIEAPYQNVTLYDGRDACGGDGWKVNEVSHHDNSKTGPVTTILTLLKPYTQYAYYVKTYTIASQKTGAQSPIQYFRTNPDTPTQPMYLKAFSNSSSEIVINWSPPSQPNGNVTHYVIQGSWLKDDHYQLQQRDYCFEPLMNLPDKKHIDVNIEAEKIKGKDECQCVDKNENRIEKDRERERQFQIKFEDTLHNQVYVKRTTRGKREIHRDAKSLNGNGDYSDTDIVKSIITAVNVDSNIKIDDKGNRVMFQHKVYGSSTFVVKKLRHFAQYMIGVQACRERVPGENISLSSNCSEQAIVTTRTLQLASADTISFSSVNVFSVEVSNHSYGVAKISWDEPHDPNGLVVTYQIEYRLVTTDNVQSKKHTDCITRRQFLEDSKSFTLHNLVPGNYSLRIHATSLAGNGEYTPYKYFEIRGPPRMTEGQVIAITIVCILIVILIVMVIYLRRQSSRNQAQKRLIASVNPEYVSTAYVPDEWEVPRKQIELLRELGQGSFGMVYEGIAHNVVPNEPTKPCAIKTVNETANDRERMEFLNEASVMKAFNTYHVVRLLGVVSQGQPTLVVMELMANGDLKTYLRSHRPDLTEEPRKQPPTLKRILQMAIEIADGMAYLSAKKFVHRDLAARNCMVAEDLTVKIGDFGMTRDIYETDYYRKGTKGLLPVRWMAPESLKDGVFTSFSDVWSYGVVLWEMATLASQPYQGLSNDQVLKYVIDGGVMERPDNCPDKLYNLMRLCWQHKPTLRPNFLDLVTYLLTDSSPDFSSVSFYHSEEGLELRGGTTSVGGVGGAIGGEEETPLCITREVEDFSLSDDEDFKHPQSSGSSKVSNGSTTPTPNGYIVRHHHNGNNIKTTKC